MSLHEDHINEFSTSTFIFACATELENKIILAVKDYVDKMIARNVHKNVLQTVTINAGFNREHATTHQISISAIPRGLANSSFNRNLVKRFEDEGGETWLEYMGKFIYDIEFYFRSTNRNSIAVLADLIMVGLLKPIYEELLKIGLEIPIINMPLSGIEQDRDMGYEHLQKLNLTITGMMVDWKQVYREDGAIIEEIGTDIITIT